MLRRGTPEGTRTPNIQNRNLTLYPIELRTHISDAGLIIAGFAGLVKRNFTAEGKKYSLTPPAGCRIIPKAEYPRPGRHRLERCSAIAAGREDHGRKAHQKRQCRRGNAPSGRRGEGRIETSADAPPHRLRVRTRSTNTQATGEQRGRGRGTRYKWLRV